MLGICSALLHCLSTFLFVGIHDNATPERFFCCCFFFVITFTNLNSILFNLLMPIYSEMMVRLAESKITLSKTKPLSQESDASSI